MYDNVGPGLQIEGCHRRFLRYEMDEFPACESRRIEPVESLREALSPTQHGRPQKVPHRTYIDVFGASGLGCTPCRIKTRGYGDIEAEAAARALWPWGT
ncbi:hypothetical protein PG993_001421 [Apiospora rasikravindrae]|uniref:Uncharacterized protein n=1 Tax=Apiospora rasikravindrae TaxID=990691 RepID=A0ABR1UE85_9PEZI